MASAAPTLAPSTKETTNYARLCRLLVDGGTKALRHTFDSFHPPATLCRVLNSPKVSSTLQSLRKKKVINATQWGKLYPSTPSSVTSKDFDITLLMVLLRNICPLTPPATGWDRLPLASDMTVEANLARGKLYRNNVYGHAIQASVDDPTFNALWQDISTALVALGVDAVSMNKLKTDSMDSDTESHYTELLKEWKNDEDNIKEKLDKMEDNLEQLKDEIGIISSKMDQTLNKLGTVDEGTIRDVFEQMKSGIERVSEKMEETLVRTFPTVDEIGLNAAEHIYKIRQNYERHEGWLAPFPWCEDFHFHLNDIYTRLRMVRRKKTARGTETQAVETTEIFKPHEECKQPKKVLIEGKPGMGKTTYCNKIAYDWATKQHAAGDCFPEFELVLLLKCRDIGSDSDLWDAIDGQLLPPEVQKEERDKFFEFIRQNQSKVLLVLDGLDESPESKLPEFSKVIEGRILPGCYLVVTARHEAGIPVRKVCDTLLEIEGFTLEDAKNFILKYFKGKNDLSKNLLKKLENDEWIKEMSANPLSTSLLCLLCEEFEGILPESRTQLYFEIVHCVLMRYRKKKGLSVESDDLIDLYKEQLSHLGKIALNGLAEDNMHFDETKLGNQHSDLPGFGLLSVQPGSSKLKPSRCYGFTHKSFQEFFAGYYLCCQLASQHISPETLLDDRSELRQVLIFTCGLLAMTSKESLVALINNITNKVNKEGMEKCLSVALECIGECKEKSSQFHIELSRTFGSSLKALFASLERIGDSGAAVLGAALKTNTTLTYLDLSHNNLGPVGAESLAAPLKTNTTLIHMSLSDNTLGPAGAESFAAALKTNTTLIDLDLSRNNLGPAGAESLAAALKTNTTLIKLYLSGNNLGPAGAESLAAALKTNTTLIELDLCDTKLGSSGVESLAAALQTSTTLINLDLSRNNLGPPDAESLASALKANTTLVHLYLCGNNLGPAGAESLAAALKTNTTLTHLYFSDNNLGPAGADSLAVALKTNATFMHLDLSGNNLGLAGAKSLATALKTNTTLIHLELCRNNLGPAGAESLAAALKTNTSLTHLYLSDNNLGPAGAESLAAALETNTTLITLYLHDNNLGLAGIESLDAASKRRKTRRNLFLSWQQLFSRWC